MSTKVSRFLTLGFVFSIALVLVFSPITRAAEFIIDGNSAFVIMFGDAYFCTDVSLPNSVNMNSNKCDSQNNKYWRHTGNMRIESNGSTTNWAFGGIVLSSGSSSLSPGYITIPIYFINGSQALNLGNATGFMATPNQSAGYFHTVDSKYEQLNENSARIIVTLYHDWTIPANTLIYLCSNSQNGTNATNNPYALNAVWSRGVDRFGVIVGNGIHYGVSSSSSSDFDDTAILNQLYSLNSSASSINSAISSLGSNSADMLDAINDLQQTTLDANQDANDRYQDEKDTINDSKDEAQNSADSMDTSGFSLGNPFSSWFGMFTNNNCVDIPKLASWIHSNETRVCTPWSSDVRSNLTPIISVIAVMVGFGLLVHWLKGDSDVGLENT